MSSGQRLTVDDAGVFPSCVGGVSLLCRGCFPLVFLSICFVLWVSSLSATGRRPAPGLVSLPAWAFEDGGVRRFAPDPPFLGLPGKTWVFPAQAGGRLVRGRAAATARRIDGPESVQAESCESAGETVERV